MSAYIIAEAGVNHNGSLEFAKSMVFAAREAGADAVKFQTFRADLLTTAAAAKAEYQETAESQTQQDMLRALELSYEDFEVIRELCDEAGIEFLSTAFDEQSADFLNELGMARFKIPSGEATNVRLIQHVARLGKPIILSTGMCSLDEVGQALRWIRDVDSSLDLWLLQCVSAYPARVADTNLLAMATMREAFSVPVGLSDHALGYSAAFGAAALGAVCIEKHFTLDRTMKGPDHAASLEPAELKSMIKGIREIESALGDGIKAPTVGELTMAQAARRSIVAARDLPVGTVLSAEDLELRRPGTGIAPYRISELVGRTLQVTLRREDLLGWEMVI